MKHAQLALDAASVLGRWADALDARARRRIRRSEVARIAEKAVADLTSLRFQVPSGCRFRELIRDVRPVVEGIGDDAQAEAFLRAAAAYLTAQARSRDPLNWTGRSVSTTFGREVALPRHAWPRGFRVR